MRPLWDLSGARAAPYTTQKLNLLTGGADKLFRGSVAGRCGRRYWAIKSWLPACYWARWHGRRFFLAPLPACSSSYSLFIYFSISLGIFLWREPVFLFSLSYASVSINGELFNWKNFRENVQLKFLFNTYFLIFEEYDWMIFPLTSSFLGWVLLFRIRGIVISSIVPLRNIYIRWNIDTLFRE